MLKVGRVDTVIVLPLHLPTVVSQQVVFAPPNVLATTAVLCAIIAQEAGKHWPTAVISTAAAP